MKQLLIILSLLLFVGCNTGSSTSSTSSTPSQSSCVGLATTYENASTAWQADMENLELCEANSAAYIALANSDCPGFEDLTETEVNTIATMCDLLTDG